MKLLYCAIYVMLLGIASHFIGLALPRRWFRTDRFPFRSFAWEGEGKFYRKLKIHKWKDKLPDASRVVKYMYRKAVDPNPNAENLNRLIQETCVAEVTHLALIVCSLGVVAIWPGIGGWICYLGCFAGNFPFVLIQRYNRPRLAGALERLTESKV